MPPPVKVTIRNLERVLGLPAPSCPIDGGPKPPGKDTPKPVAKPVAKHWYVTELISARCAMAAQLLGPAVASETGLSVAEQLQQHPAPCLTLVAAVCLYFGMITSLTLPMYNPKGLPEQIEMGLGQVAMLLFVLSIS